VNRWWNKIFCSFLSVFILACFLTWPVGFALADELAPPTATAGTEKSQAPANSKSNSKGTKRTNVDFEDQLVQGEVKKPELFYLLQKKQFNFGKLIKLRENFIPEMSKTAEDVERTR
jgi:hypothetical protein